MEYLSVGLLIICVIAIVAIVGYYQNKVAQVNEEIKTIRSQKQASDNDIKKYREDLQQFLKGDLDGPAAADLLDSLRN